MSLPNGFTYLEAIDASILQEMRYAGYHNFIGRPLDGYHKPKCIVSIELGTRLKRVQQAANKLNLTLKVYDAYRPLRAVEDIVLWSQDASLQLMKAEFYAHINKADFFKLQFVAIRSYHCRGAAVDLTLVELPVKEQPIYTPGDKLINGIEPYDIRFADNSIDMGTGFDCMHELSHTHNPKITGKQQANRQLLCSLMEAEGFFVNPREWWHFGLINEPFPEMFFDFIIE